MCFCLVWCCSDFEKSQQIGRLELNCDSLLAIAELQAGANTDMANIYLNKVLTLIDPDKCSSNLGKYHMVKGRVYYYLDEYITSVIHLDSAIQIFEKLGADQELAKSYSFKSSSLAYLGEFTESLESSLQSIQLIDEQSDWQAKVRSYNLMASIYLEKGDFEQALAHSGKSIIEARYDTISLQYATSLTIAGKIHLKMKDLEKAESYALRAYNIRVLCANMRHIASSLSYLAEIRLLKSNYNTALLNLAEAQKIFSELNEKTGLFITYQLYSKVYKALFRFPEAFNYAHKAYDLALEINSKSHLSKACFNLFELYEAKGNFPDALKYFKIYHAHINEETSSELNNEIAAIEQRYELINKTKDNEILTQKNKIKRMWVLFLALASAALLILLVSVVIFFRYKSQSLERKKEKAEANSILHTRQKEILERDLELKNKELTSKTVELLHQIETLQTLTGRIEGLKSSSSKKEVEEILHELKLKTRENVWDEFHAAFNNVHNEFYDRLFGICPDLSSTEIKIAALLKLNLSTKEIAAISYKTESAIKVARHRLRQKLKLDQTENLINFLLKV